jgi:hypothetical protein
MSKASWVPEREGWSKKVGRCGIFADLVGTTANCAQVGAMETAGFLVQGDPLAARAPMQQILGFSFRVRGGRRRVGKVIRAKGKEPLFPGGVQVRPYPQVPSAVSRVRHLYGSYGSMCTTYRTLFQII